MATSPLNRVFLSAQWRWLVMLNWEVDPELLQRHVPYYWGYSQQRDGSTFEYRVKHPAWKIWQANNVKFECDVKNLYGEKFQATLSRQPNSSFIADGSKVTVSFPRRIK